MKLTRLIMGMPITIWVVDENSKTASTIDKAFALFTKFDRIFSTYRPGSQISLINSGKLTIKDADAEVQSVIRTCRGLKKRMLGYFDINYNAKMIDPSGYVKGWAIKRACELLDKYGYDNYCVDAGGDVMFQGKGDENGTGWLTGIASPSDDQKIVKILWLKNRAIATSGDYIRGQHIFNPHAGKPADQLASVSAIGPDICMADVLATTIFAMGQDYGKYLPQILPRGYDVFVIDRHN